MGVCAYTEYNVYLNTAVGRKRLRHLRRLARRRKLYLGPKACYL